MKTILVPNEIWSLIFTFCTLDDLDVLACTCTVFNGLITPKLRANAYATNFVIYTARKQWPSWMDVNVIKHLNFEIHEIEDVQDFFIKACDFKKIDSIKFLIQRLNRKILLNAFPPFLTTVACAKAKTNEVDEIQVLLKVNFPDQFIYRRRPSFWLQT